MVADTNMKLAAAASATTSSEVVVAVRGLVKVFKDFWGRSKARAVDEVSFEVRRGEVFGLLGPNGSGKSTTVKMLLGLLYPTAGHIEVFGHSPRHVLTKARIGYLPEESYLYRYLDSRETLQFFGNLFTLPAAERRQRAMQRRIGLAQALINDPDLIILDEPTSGLDPIGCREVKDLILALARRGKTIILSSHLLADVEDVCDRVVIYYGGKVQAMGMLRDLLAKPDSLRITTPLLPRATIEQVLAILRHDVAEDRVRVDTPTQNLEAYFLEVVQKAKQQSAQTSGATAGGQVAAYLRGAAETGPVADKILERLTQGAAPEPVPQPVAQPVAPPDVQKLDTLTRPGVSVAVAPAPAPVAPPVDLHKANEKLAGLLMKGK